MAARPLMEKALLLAERRGKIPPTVKKCASLLFSRGGQSFTALKQRFEVCCKAKIGALLLRQAQDIGLLRYRMPSFEFQNSATIHDLLVSMPKCEIQQSISNN